jgi:hypothetical protein
MIGDSETRKRVKNGKDADQAPQEIMNGSEAPGRMKGEMETDESIEKFVNDLIKPLKKS